MIFWKKYQDQINFYSISLTLKIIFYNFHKYFLLKKFFLLYYNNTYIKTEKVYTIIKKKNHVPLVSGFINFKKKNFLIPKLYDLLIFIIFISKNY
ncbi:hypothetical protein DRW41_22440 [Neobacillus piezotolerans]|uniref:Uncharacterized protein n=1 Tax=Neobacillus piezotolerans TaxID=2259171 RepID=A0A3D8GJK0_9BACI|nr:hypothetical protein DRW41_22440 [Neobacillus piezotolerans]